MEKSLLVIFLLLINIGVFAQSDEELVRKTLMYYLEGTSTNQPEMIKQAFYPDADLYLSKPGQDIWVLSPEEYSDLFDRGTPGEPNGRFGEILSLDIEDNIALAKAEILIPSGRMRFIDAFLLKKVDGEWKVISKTATGGVVPRPEIVPVKDTIVEGLDHPWSMAFMNETEVLLTEKNRDLVHINLTTLERNIITGFPKDLTDSIGVLKRGDNSGIFEVVLDPDFENNQVLYLSYAAKKGSGTTTKVIRARLANNQLKEIKTLLEASPYTREYYHYGGGMVFGQDGKLYITIGERLFWERDNPAIPIAQNPKDKRGKIYRINPDGTIPEDNPDFGPDAIPGLYAMGIRAAQGITVEPSSGTIWFSEHGTRQGDELNILEAGANYGWPLITSGAYRSKDYSPPPIEENIFSDPIWYWLQTVAPTGLTFYTGTEFPDWQGNLLVSGLSRGSLWRFTVEDKRVKHAEELFVDDRVRSRKIIQSPGGKLYILTDEDNGKIIRIQPK